MAKSEILGIQGKIKIQDKENEDLELLEILERILIRKRGYVIKIPPRGSNVVACMSGGLDSTINLAILMEEFGLKVYPFFINRGQSAYIYEKASVDWYNEFFKKRYPNLYNDVIEINLPTPAKEYKDLLRKTKKSIRNIPLRNNISYPARNSIIFLTGMEYGYSLQSRGIHINTVFASHVSSDNSFHCSLTWTRLTNLTMCQITNDWSWQFISLPIERSLGNYYDKDIYIKWAIKHKIPLKYTRTCVKNSEFHCGICPPCYERRRVFKEKLKIKDEVKYLYPMPKRMLSYEAKVITFITSNPRKKKIFENLFKDQDVMVITKNIKIPEIQAEDPEEVVSFATKYCSQLLNSPVVKIDTGFFVEELNGFPGPFVHYIDKQLGCERFLKILKGVKNRKAYIKVALGYCEPGEKPVIFSYKIPGVIVDKIRDKEGSFIDKLFIPIHKKNPEMKTMGEIRKEKPEIINEIWGNIENKFAQWFIKNKL